MPEQKTNPLLSHILGAVADRQGAELAKLELLDRVGRGLEHANGKLDQVVELLGELVERSKRP